MKKLLLVHFVFSSLLFAQWIQTNGPIGGTVNCIASNGINLFVGTEDGSFYLSSDSGITWKFQYKFFHPIKSMIIKESTIWTLNGASEVIKSTDNGLNWYKSVSYYTFQAYVFSIALINSKLFLGTSGKGIYLSSDNGVNWSLSNSGITGSNVNSFAVKENNIFALVDYALFMSTNEGSTWNLMHTGFSEQSDVNCITSCGSDLYAGTQIGIFNSLDNGLTWRKINNGLTDYHVNTILAMGIKIFAGTNNGIFTSNMNDTTWSESGSGLGNKCIKTLHSSGTVLFTGTKGGGIYTSADNGFTWLNMNLKASTIIALASAENKIFAATDFGKVILSTDNGENWNEVFSTTHTITTLFFNGTTLYLGTYNGFIYKSSDNGINWTEYQLPSFQISIMAFAGNPENMFAAGNGVYRSTDLGNTWHITGNSIYAYSITMIGNSIFIGGAYGDVQTSNDYGATWTYCSNGIPDGSVITSIVKFNDDLFLSGKYLGTYRSTNNGLNWSGIGGCGTDVKSLLATTTNLFAAGNSGVFLLTRISGPYGYLYFKSLNEGLINNEVISLAANNEFLFVGTSGHGVWKCYLQNIPSGADDQIKMAGYSLYQNFPNPFNPSTLINYSIPSESKVTLKIFDLVGREIETLVNEEKPAGDYTINFDAHELSSGIYFYSIQAGDFSEVKKMIFLK